MRGLLELLVVVVILALLALAHAGTVSNQEKRVNARLHQINSYYEKALNHGD